MPASPSLLARVAAPARLGLLVGVAALAAARPLAADDSLDSLKNLSLDELLDVEITSVSKRPERLLEAASAIQVITDDDLRRSGAVLLPEALRLADGLDVARRGSHQWAISARGFNTDLANKLLVLMDGRSIYTPLYSGVFWDAQDYLLEDLDRIEVISGPGGTLWGANAVNGVINIISKEARDTQGWFTEAAAGDPLHAAAAVRYGGRLAPDVYFRVYGKFLDRGAETTAAGASAHDAWDRRQGGFRLDADPSSSDTFTLQGDLYRNREDVPAGGASRSGGGNLLGRWSHASSADSDFTLQLYFDRTHLDQPVPAYAFAPAGRLTDDLDTWDLDFHQHLRLALGHQLVWGFGYRFTRDRVGNAAALALLPARLDQHLFSAFAQDEIPLPGRFVLTLGSKFEHNDYTGVELEPDLRLQWNVSERHLLWTAVSRAVRTPSRIDRDLSEPAPAYPPVVLRGSPDFDSETLLAFEAGWRAQLTASATVSLSAFVNRYDRIRSTSLSPLDPVFHLPLPLYFENNLEGNSRGLELSASWQPHPRWRLHAGYALLREDLDVKPGRADFNHALNEVADPGQRLSLRSSLDLPHGFECDIQFRWVDSRLTNNVGVTALVPAYAEADARLAWRPVPALELSLVGQNLLHPRQLEYGVPTTASIEPGRSVYGKVSWRF